MKHFLSQLNHSQKIILGVLFLFNLICANLIVYIILEFKTDRSWLASLVYYAPLNIIGTLSFFMLAYYFGRIQQWFYRLIMTIGWAIGVVYLSSFVTLTLITLYVKYLSPAIHSVEKAYPLLDTLLLPFSLVYYTGWFIGVFIVVNYVFLIWYAHVHVVNTPKPD